LPRRRPFVKNSPSKKDALLNMLAQGLTLVHIDARRAGVEVPPEFRTDATLRLNLSYRFPDIDLDIDDDAVRATLTFGSMRFRCVLPWSSIFAMTLPQSQEGLVWPDDLPPELAAALQELEETQRRPSEDERGHIPGQESAHPPRIWPRNSQITSNPDSQFRDAAHQQKTSVRQRRPPVLRVIRGGAADVDDRNLNQQTGIEPTPIPTPASAPASGSSSASRSRRWPPYLKVIK